MSALSALCEREHVKVDYREGNKERWDSGQHHYRVTLRAYGRRLTVDFWTNGAPDAAGVLYCLLADASYAGESFEDFCGNTGSDTDSRKALATYDACCALAPRVRRLLGEHFDTFARAEH